MGGSAAASPCAATAQDRAAPATISAKLSGALQSRPLSASLHKRNASTAEETTSYSAVGAHRQRKSPELHGRRGEQNQQNGSRRPVEQPHGVTGSRSAGGPRHCKEESEARVKRRWRTHGWRMRRKRTFQWPRARWQWRRQCSRSRLPAFILNLKLELLPPMFRAI